MHDAPPLLAGRLSRRGLSWLVGAVLIVTPFESMTDASTPFYVTLAVRVVVLAALFVALRTHKIETITAGRIFLGIGLWEMIASSVVSPSTPNGIVIEAVAYGTILPILALLIAPRRSRRRWSLAVTGVVAVGAAARLIPGDELFLVQLMAIIVVHTAAVMALDFHANRAEQAGAMATIDQLTGLVNRRPAIERMTAELVAADEGAPASCVIMVDLDHFKQVNDTLGHEAGDDALRRVAGALSGLVRAGDTLCRWGGEEFLILLTGVESDTAAGVAERMRVEVGRLGVTASFGVAQASDRNTVAEWVHRADKAMYLAKRNGRNQVFVEDQSTTEFRPAPT